MGVIGGVFDMQLFQDIGQDIKNIWKNYLKF
jgi:hypothetical protein